MMPTANSSSRRLGVFGGTFDPPHLGHLAVAQEAIHQLRLDRLLFVPAAVPPHKRGQPITDAALRVEMLGAAVAGLERAEVSEIELGREGPSYTVDTLRELGGRYPDARLFLVLGADQVRELDTWRAAAEVRRLATLAVFHRAGEAPVLPGDEEMAERAAGPARPERPDRTAESSGLVVIEVPRLDLSSTEIRRRVAAGEPVRFLVPDGVRAVIEREGLYRGAGAGG